MGKVLLSRGARPHRGEHQAARAQTEGRLWGQSMIEWLPQLCNEAALLGRGPDTETLATMRPVRETGSKTGMTRALS